MADIVRDTSSSVGGVQRLGAVTATNIPGDVFTTLVTLTPTTYVAAWQQLGDTMAGVLGDGRFFFKRLTSSPATPVSGTVWLQDTAGVTGLYFQGTQGLVAVGTGGGGGSGALVHLAALRAVAAPSGAIETLGYYAAGDGGGQAFYWDAASNLADNGGNVIVPNSWGAASGRWRAVETARIDAKKFGILADNSTDNTARMQIAHATGKVVYYPAGRYRFTTITMNTGGIEGDGKDTILDSTDTSANHLITHYAGDNTGLLINELGAVFRNFYLRCNTPTQKSGGAGIRLAPSTNETAYTSIIENITVRYCPISISTTMTSYLFIRGCYLTFYNQFGLYCDDNTVIFGDNGDQTVIGNIFKTDILTGVGVRYRTGGGRFIGNKFIGGLGGLDASTLQPTSILIFDGNSVEDHVGFSLKVRAEADNSSGQFGMVIISNNQFNGATIASGNCVQVDTGSYFITRNITISDNSIRYYGTGNAIMIGNAALFEIADNVIDLGGVGFRGILIDSTATSGRLAENLVSADGGGGAFLNLSGSTTVAPTLSGGFAGGQVVIGAGTNVMAGTNNLRFTGLNNLLLGSAASEAGMTGAGGISVGSTTNATSTVTGSLLTAGGLAVSKSAYVGGLLVVAVNPFSQAYSGSGGVLSVGGTLVTDTLSAGTVAVHYCTLLAGNALAAASVTTYTDAYNLYVSAPGANTNVTITNRWAAGFGGAVTFQAGTTATLGGSNIINAGNGVLTVGGTTDTTALGTGALMTAGGVSIAKQLRVGTDVTVTGSLAVGGIVDGTSRLRSQYISTATAQKQNAFLDLFVRPSGASSADSIGLLNSVTADQANTNLSAAALYGASTLVRLSTAGASTVAALYGSSIQPSVVNSGGAGTAAVTAAYGVFVQSSLNAASGATATIGTLYGIYLATPSLTGAGTKTITTTWGIYQQDPAASNLFAGSLSTAAATAATAGLTVPHGTTPTSPIDGAVWTTTAGLFVRINGVTVGPISAGGGGGIGGGIALNQVAYGAGTSNIQGSSAFTYSGTELTIGGSLGLGGIVDATSRLRSQYISTATTQKQNAFFDLFVRPSGASSADSISIQSNVTADQANTNLSAAALYGVSSVVQLNTPGASTVAALYGGSFQPSVINSGGAGSATATTAYGVFVQPSLNAASGATATIGTLYGIYLATSALSGVGTKTVTTTWGIYQQDPTASNLFAGAVSVGGSLTVGSLSSGRVPFVGTAGLLQSSLGLQYTNSLFALTLGDGTSGVAPVFAFSSPAGQAQELRYTTNGSRRWVQSKTGAAEAGSDTGSDFALLAYNDANGIIDTPISITRAAGGAIALSRPVTMSGTLTVGSLTSARIPFAGASGLLGDSAGLTYTTSTASLLVAQTLSGTATTASAVVDIFSSRTIGASGNTNQIGVQSVVTMTGGFTPASSTVTGGSFSGVSNVTSSFVGSATSAVTGVRASASHAISGTGGLGTIVGADITVTTGSLGGTLSSASYGARLVCTNVASVPNVYGISIALGGGSGSTTITNRYGLWLENLGSPVISGTDFAIYQSGAGIISQFEGRLLTSASTTSRAGVNVAHGAAPTTPVNGDVWTTTGGLFARINGATVGPYGAGSVTSVSVTTANGVSGTVATATTTPAITLTLGAITPSSIVASGTISGSNLSGTNTGNQTITLTGDVTGSGPGSFAATLASTITAAGPIGSGTVVPVITFDAKGRLTAVTTAAITAAGVGAIGGSIASTQVAVGSGANTIAGSGGLIFSGSSLQLGSATTNTIFLTDTAASRTVRVSSDGNIGTTTAHDFQFLTGSLTRVTLKSTGEVVIGTDPGGGELLRVGGDTRIQGAVLMTTGVASRPFSSDGNVLTAGGTLLTDTSSAGTVAVRYDVLLAGNALAASSVTTYTDAYNLYVSAPGANTNVTITNRWAAGFASTVRFFSDIKFTNAGTGLHFKEGTNAIMGVATLVAGTVVVSTSKIAANSRVFISRATAGGTLGHLSYVVTSVGVSFTIDSSSTLETSTINWVIIAPA